MSNFISLLLGVFLLVLLLFLFKRLSATKKKLENAEKTVIKILTKTVGSSCDLRLQDSKTIFSGTVENVDKHVNISGMIPMQYLGSDVTVFLRVVLDGEEVYYWFTSTILEISGKTVTLALPARVSLGEKRLFLRVVPKQEDILSLAIWKEERNTALPSNITASPMLTSDGKNMALANISVTGAALSFEGSSPLLVGDSILLFLTFQTAEERHSLYLATDVLHVRACDLGELVSLKFAAYAEVENQGDAIPWTLCRNDEGVPILQSFVEQS